MPITEKNGKWYWGEQGPYDTKEAAQRVATAAYLSGYKKKTGVMPKKKPYRGKFIRDGKIIRKAEDPTEKSKQWLIDTVERAYPQVSNLRFGGEGTIDSSYIRFNCHNLRWFVNLNRIIWTSSVQYTVCVVSDNNTTALYDQFLSRVDIIASQTFGVVPVLEFAWELYQLDVAYPKFKFYGEYYTPIESSSDFYEHHWDLRKASRVNLDDENSHRFNTSLWVNSGENKEVYNETVKMAKEKIEFVRELYQQILGRELQ